MIYLLYILYTPKIQSLSNPCIGFQFQTNAFVAQNPATEDQIVTFLKKDNAGFITPMKTHQEETDSKIP